MIREADATDTDAILGVAEASGLFEADQLDTLRASLERSFAGTAEREEQWLVDVEDGTVVAVAYSVLEPMTDRVWNLLFLAVHPGVQGRGHGSALLAEVEARLRARRGRMMIIETAGGDDFEATRAFYRKAGYEQEGAVRDFYADGMDKVVFRKLI